MAIPYSRVFRPMKADFYILAYLKLPINQFSGFKSIGYEKRQ